MKILIRGRPGVGKTTLVRKILQALKNPYTGFLTEEIRKRGKRVGFKIVTFAGREGILAHRDLKGPYRVSDYGVNLEDFEKVALPVLERAKENWIVLDEIGKMELFSTRFKKIVTDLFAQETLSIIATIPICRLPFIEGLIKTHKPKLFTLELNNRDQIAHKLLTLITGQTNVSNYNDMRSIG